jgi:hypothetical protein
MSITEPTIDAVTHEADRASAIYGNFNSPHEVFGVLQLEMLELAEEIHVRNWHDAREEAIQIAAVAMRFVDKMTELERAGVL